MSKLFAFTTVACPFEHVPDRLREYFGGEDATMPLRVRFADLNVERDVEIHLAPKPGYPGYRLIDVTWRAAGGGPYPVFHGTLSVEEEAGGWSRLDLDGDYDPPFGLIGAAVDAAVGHRVAEATANDLLSEFKRILSRVPA